MFICHKSGLFIWNNLGGIKSVYCLPKRLEKGHLCQSKIFKKSKA